MGDGFSARVATLWNAGHQARTVTAQLRAEAKNRLSGDTVDAGHHALGQEIAAFQERARDLAAGVAEQGDSIGEGLIETARAYEDADTEAAALFDRTHGGSGA